MPISQHIRTLNAARLAADIADVPTLIVARTDALAANLLTSDVDERDAQFATGERTAEGFHRVRNGMAPVIARGLAYAPYADLIWVETGTPDLAQAREFAEAVHAEHPDQMLAHNCSPSFNWKAALDDDQIAKFQRELGAMGYRFQFITLAGFHSLNHGMFDLARGYAKHGITAMSTSRSGSSPRRRRASPPLDAAAERDIDPQILRWLSFAKQKTAEIVTLAKGLALGTDAITGELAANRAALMSRATSLITRAPAVRARVAAVTDAEARRSQPYGERAAAQRAHLGLPLLPTTTIGSFPQTTDLRTARADLRAGRIDTADYEERIKAEIGEVISFQEKAGLDVLVHGEAERNDMVQYFAEQLTGYLATQHGWVQSYGTRYVRPPVLAGDISRPEPMTVRWTSYAQSLTSRPVKGLLTGPVTTLAWSFVRDDQPLGDTARQVALTLRDEVNDLEAAGTSVIQVDEPALRETLPLRACDRPAYLAWATESFRLTTSGVRPDTQIHTHMCYAEFGDIVQAIDDLDADVISLEAARSHMQVARELAAHGYPREAGPGVYDIHSPRVPSAEEAAELLRTGLKAIPAERLWVNPDCGLKTRGWPETRTSLEHLVAAARTLRGELSAS